MKVIKTPLTEKVRKKLKAGEEVLLSGEIYTARDAAHKCFSSLLKRKNKLPFSIKDSIIYYAGPTPKRKNGTLGSCGPTTSSRMDSFTCSLLEKGLGGMIGKGKRSEEVKKCIKNKKSVYFITIGGAGAYLAKRIKSSKVVAFKELGPEAVYKLDVEDFPLIVGVDSTGKDVYDK